MMCFEIDDKIRPITLKKPYNEVMVGEKETGSFFRLPLHPAYAAAARQSVTRLMQSLNLPDLPPQITLEEANLDRRNGLVLTKKGPARIESPNGDVEVRWDKLALVLVKTPPGEGGKTLLASDRPELELVENTARLTYKPFPADGIELLGSGKSKGFGDDLVDETLLVMQPKSRFRIFRTGKLEGAPSHFLVKWDWMRGRDSKMHLDLRMIPN